MKTIYMTPWYDEKKPERLSELVTCINKVHAHKDIDLIIVLVEGDVSLVPLPDTERVKFVPVTKRPTYQNFIEVANQLTTKGDIVIIANTDIFPDEDTIKLCQGINHNECFALSRWDINAQSEGVHWDHADSQDVWVFKAPIKQMKSDFPLGIPGCDNRIAYEIRKAHYIITNPSKDICFYHLHLSGIRNYKNDRQGQSGRDFIPRPYLTLKPTKLRDPDMFARVLHIGMPQPGLERAFRAKAKAYGFINWKAKEYEGNPGKLRQSIMDACSHGPSIIFMQIQTANIITKDLIGQMRAASPTDTFILNWTGDVRKPLPGWYIDLAPEIDLSLFTNTDDINTMGDMDLRADYLQIGYDEKVFNQIMVAPKKQPSVVFMGNNYDGDRFPLSEFRREMVCALKTQLWGHAGIYGSNWGFLGSGNLMGKELDEVRMYAGCKIAINLSHFNYGRYSSDRVFRIMASGAFCLTFPWPGMEQEGFKDGETCVVWKDLKELSAKIKYYMANDQERIKIQKAGTELVTKTGQWGNRLNELQILLNNYINGENYNPKRKQ